MVCGCGFVVAAGLVGVWYFAVVLGAWAAGECSEECCLHGPCYCLGNSSIRRVRLAINAVGLLKSSTNNKISVCGWCKFDSCITSLVITYVSVSGRRG